jgi:PAS domain S-box-containing protein
MERTYDFIANTADGVFAVDFDQIIVLWNEAASAMLGYDSSEVLGRHCYAILRGRDTGDCALCRQGCASIKAATRLEFPPTQAFGVRTKRGDAIWLNVSTIIVPSENQSLSVLIHLLRDVTREHRPARVAREFGSAVSLISRDGRAGRAPSAPKVRPPVRLTRRQKEILENLTTGVSTEAIADTLCLSPRTVRNHVNNILNSLGVHSRLEAVTYSIRNGLV